MTELSQHAEAHVYQQQGFGTPLPVLGNIGLLIVDFVVGFADPATFGGGNIGPAITRTVDALALARRHGWPVAHSRIVYAADGSDDNVFSIKVPGMATLTEDHPNSAIVPD
jgi:maleamate amidohydrolase